MRVIRVALAGLLVGGVCWIFPSSAAAAPANPVVEARREVSAAKTDLGKLLRVVNGKKARAQTALRASPEYKEAVLARNKATAELRTASAPVLATIRSGDEFKALRTKRTRLASELTALRRSGEGDSERATAAAEELAAAKAELKALEDQALLADPSTAPAKTKLDEAEAQLATLEAQMIAELGSDSAYSGAASQLDEAKARVTNAEKALKTVTLEDRRLRRQARAAALAAAQERRKGRVISTGSS